jgi:two-component system OmpR family sensor kinase
MRSIRRTLLVTLLAAVAVVTLIAALLVYRSARREIDAIFDYHLRQMALTLRDEVPRQSGPGVGAGGYDFVIQVWTPDGVRLYLSDPGSAPPESAELGFATVQSGGTSWRVYSALLSGLVVQVAQPLRVRQGLAFAAALRTFAPVLVVLPLLDRRAAGRPRGWPRRQGRFPGQGPGGSLRGVSGGSRRRGRALRCP